MNRTVLIMLMGVALTGFVNSGHAAEQLSRDEQLALNSKSYQKNVSEVFAAAEKLFQLADKPKDLTITYPDAESMIVVRRASAVVIRTQYRWTITAASRGDSTNVNVSLNTAAGSMMRLPGGGTPTTSPDVIRLFFSRMDYLLGQSGDWVSCEDYDAQHPDHSVMDALCFGVQDEHP